MVLHSDGGSRGVHQEFATARGVSTNRCTRQHRTRGVGFSLPGRSKRAPIDGRVVVTRTQDGRKTFDILTNGLPQQHAYDLVLRRALDISNDGYSLAMGSSTGNLDITANQRDQWHGVAKYLPPIYSVRYK